MIQCGKCECVQVVFTDGDADDFFYHPKMNKSICEVIAEVAELPVDVEFNFLRYARLTDEGEFIDGGEIIDSCEETITTDDLS